MDSSTPSTWKYNVFPSFHGPDVRKTFLSHLRKQFNFNGITMFDDQGIERSLMIAPALTQAIRESRISIVVLSKNYASSSWCLDELLEILKCKEDIGQIVMTVFHGVDPSDVRKQTGEFGIAFNETCACKTEEKRQKWSQALNDVGNIAGEHFLNWDNEAIMIEKIAKDVLDKLNATPSRDFDGIVGLEAHLREMESLLDLDYVGVKMVAITGPAGIGKTTIARALQSRVSNRFQLTCFMENLRGSYLSGLDEYGLKLCLQKQFLSKVLNQNGMEIYHLGAINTNLRDQRVLIILDDVNDLKQLEALTNETTWFGPGSRILITTENKELLQQHGINITYHVGFPSDEQALKILSRYAFRQTSPCDGFRNLARRVTWLCGNLPLGLRVVGSSLHGKNEDEWEYVICRLVTVLDHRDIEEVLRVGFESLHENEQSLFLHIAVFFNYYDGDLLKAMFADDNLDIKHELTILVNKSLVSISENGIVQMHKLLQQMGTKAVQREEPWKRRILIDAREICDVLERAEGGRHVSGISLDTSGIDEVSIGKGAFKRMPFLRFLKVYKSKNDGNYSMHIPEGIEFPRRLKLLHWEEYPRKSLPDTLQVKHIVELNMHNSQLEYLWQGTQLLTKLKKMDLSSSYHLKELPDFSNATNLEELDLSYCESLVEIPSSFSHLQKLSQLRSTGCINLEVIPAHMNLASLKCVLMKGCSRLRNIPIMTTNSIHLNISRTVVKDVPPSISLSHLNIGGCRNFKELTHLPTSLRHIKLRNSEIERIPDCIKDLHQLKCLEISGCRRLTSLPEIPRSLIYLLAKDCESLENIFCPLNTPNVHLDFTNCFKLGQEARKAIIQHSVCHMSAVLPGRKVPSDFDHRAKGNTLTIRLDGNHYTGFVVCIVISPSKHIRAHNKFSRLLCRRSIAKGGLHPVEELVLVVDVYNSRSEHLFLFPSSLLNIDPSELSRGIALEFSNECNHFKVIECSAMILTEENIKGSYESGSDQVIEDKIECESGEEASEDEIEFDPSEETFEDETNVYDRTNEVICDAKEEENLHGERHADCWSWLFLCFGLSDFVRRSRKLGFGKETIKPRS